MGYSLGSNRKPGRNVPLELVFGAKFVVRIVQATAMAVVIDLAVRA
jgi:hypothetical protein